MTGLKENKMKSLGELKKGELREELKKRGLEEAGTKNDLYLRLREALLEEGKNPDTEKFDTKSVSENLALLSLLEEIREQNSRITEQNKEMKNEIFNVKEQNKNLKDEISSQVRATIEENLGAINRKVSDLEEGLETVSGRVQAVEDKVESRLREASSSIKDVKGRVDKIEGRLGVKEADLKLQIESILRANPVAINTGSNVSVDPRVIRESLPEYHGRLEEDPELFLNNSTALLKRTNLPNEIFVHILTQQLRGPAATWWNNLRGLNLDWESFKEEFTSRFNSVEIQAAANKKFLTETQPTGMRAGAFIIQKLQLYRRLHPDSNGDEALPYIIDLLGDKIRHLVNVAQPKTFNDLRSIIRKLEEEHRIGRNEEKDRKCYKCNKIGHLRDKCPQKEN